MTVLVKTCAICNDSRLNLLWDLPGLPFTEKYGSYDPARCPAEDQQLLQCACCGHVQLGKQMDPESLYTSSEYSFRTTTSSTAKSGCSFFLDFFHSLRNGQTFASLLDIGGNDLYLAQAVREYARARTVVDPICAFQDGLVIDGVKVLGRFIEDVDLQKDLPQPDLIFCRHVLEHIAQPRLLLEKLFRECAENTLYIFEIPCFDCLVEARRFDAIFHQHYHYYTLDTLKRLICEAGGKYVSHRYYYAGPCGGSLFFAFQRSAVQTHPEAHSAAYKAAHFAQAISDYRAHMKSLAYQIATCESRIYGYGASLMLATLAYQLGIDLSKLVCILDDDPEKNGIGYQNLPVTVRHPKEVDDLQGAHFLITSLENTRPIFKRITEFSARRIFVPPVA